MIPKIETVKAPQVGKFYLVPCVWHKLNDFFRADWLPVIGPWHEDAGVIGFDQFHFHYDWRFMPDFACDRRLPFSHAKVLTDKLKEERPPEATYLRRKMRRQMPEFPGRRSDGEPVSWIKPIEEIYASHTLKCRTCPHRGMSLDGLPIDAQGRVVCNGHGLRWNLTTGKLSPRNKTPESAQCTAPGLRPAELGDTLSAGSVTHIRLAEDRFPFEVPP